MTNVTVLLGKFLKVGNGYADNKGLSLRKYNHFEFEDDGVRCWRHSLIGEGVKFTIPKGRNTSVDFLVKYHLTKVAHPKKQKPITYNVLGTSDSNAQEDECSGDRTPDQPIEGCTYRCWNSACDLRFTSYENLVQHNLSANCSYRKHTMGMYNYVSRVWIDKYSSANYEKLTTSERRSFATHLECLLELKLDPTIPRKGHFMLKFNEGNKT